MYRIQHSGRYPPLLRVSPRGRRTLPQLGKCISDPETWCARCVWPLPTARTKFHVLNRIFPVGAAPAVLEGILTYSEQGGYLSEC